MDSVSQFLTPIWAGLGAQLGPYLPKILGALVILVAAGLTAKLVRSAIVRTAARARLEERLQSAGLAHTLAGVGAGLVWLLALPALLGTLELQGLLTPVNAMLSRLMGFVPNVMGAAVVLGIGILVARIVQQVASGLLRAAGSERLAEKLGLASTLGTEGLAGLAGRIVFVLLLLPTLLAALQPLGLNALTEPLSRLFDTLVQLVPKLISAALVVGIAVLAGRALANLSTALLAGAGLDRLPERLGAGPAASGAPTPGAAPAPLRLAGRTLSDWVGAAVMLGVVMVAIAQATEILGLPVLTEIVAVSGAALARLMVAVVVLVAGVLVATIAARAIEGGTLPNARGVAWAARASILFFTGALALRQAGLPAEIVAIAFGAVVGAVAIALAVAFGIGGRDVAARALERVASSFDAPTATAHPNVTASSSAGPEARHGASARPPGTPG